MLNLNAKQNNHFIFSVERHNKSTILNYFYQFVIEPKIEFLKIIVHFDFGFKVIEDCSLSMVIVQDL